MGEPADDLEVHLLLFLSLECRRCRAKLDVDRHWNGTDRLPEGFDLFVMSASHESRQLGWQVRGEDAFCPRCAARTKS